MTAEHTNGTIFTSEYPTENGPLHSNVSFATGYCFHQIAPVDTIELYLNGCYQDTALHGYPRLDVLEVNPTGGDRSLRSGFQCFFDPKSLVHGLNQFDFQIHVRGQPSRLVRITSRLAARLPWIADVSWTS